MQMYVFYYVNDKFDALFRVCASLIPSPYSLLLETSVHSCMIDQCVAVDFRTTHSCYIDRGEGRSGKLQQPKRVSGAQEEINLKPPFLFSAL